jgi:DnaJ family protein C protein 7
MVLPKIFTKKPTRKTLNTKDKDKNTTADPRSPPDSPEKRERAERERASPSSSIRSSYDKDKDAKPNRPSLSPTKSSRPKATYDPDSHPLNFPPELRRLSALSAMATNDQSFKDVDMDRQQTSSPTTASSTPTTPSANGFASDPIAPEVPPHRIPTSSPPVAQKPPAESKPQVDPEIHKAAGNKFFKAKEYVKAIAEYSKGIYKS